MPKKRPSSQEPNDGATKIEGSDQQETDAREHISLQGSPRVQMDRSQVSHYQIEDMLEAIPKRALRDDRIWSYYCMAVFGIGILLVFIAAALAISGNVVAATEDVAAGFIINALTASVYKIRKDAQERIDTIWNKLLEEKERSRIIELIKGTEGESRERLVECLIDAVSDSLPKQIPEQSSRILQSQEKMEQDTSKTSGTQKDLKKEDK